MVRLVSIRRRVIFRRKYLPDLGITTFLTWVTLGRSTCFGSGLLHLTCSWTVFVEFTFWNRQTGINGLNSQSSPELHVLNSAWLHFSRFSNVSTEFTLFKCKIGVYGPKPISLQNYLLWYRQHYIFHNSGTSRLNVRSRTVKSASIGQKAISRQNDLAEWFALSPA